jgi:hypothetical protein
VPDDVGGCPRDAGFRRNLVEACRSESDDIGVGWGKDWGQKDLGHIGGFQITTTPALTLPRTFGERIGRKRTRKAEVVSKSRFKRKSVILRWKNEQGTRTVWR